MIGSSFSSLTLCFYFITFQCYLQVQWLKTIYTARYCGFDILILKSIQTIDKYNKLCYNSNGNKQYLKQIKSDDAIHTQSMCGVASGQESSMKNSKIISLSCISLALLLTGCQRVPENITNGSSAAQRSDYTAEPSQGSRVNVENLSSDIDREISEILNTSYDNLAFPGTLEVNIPPKIGIYRIKCIDKFQNNSDKVFHEYIPADEFDPDNIDDGAGTEPAGPAYIGDDGFYCGIGRNGFFNLQPPEIGKLSTYNQPCEKSFLLSGKPADKFLIGEKEMTVVQMAEEAQKEADRFISISGYPMSLAVLKVNIYKNDQIQFYTADYSIQYKGVDLLSVLPRTDSQVSFPFFPVAAGNCFKSSGDGKNGFTVQVGFEEYETVNEYETVISLKDACGILNKKLSAYKKYDVLGVSLVYVPELAVDVKNPDEQITVLSSNDIVELTPYWAFYFNITPGKEIMGLVDCNTGEAEFFNNAIG